MPMPELTAVSAPPTGSESLTAASLLDHQLRTPLAVIAGHTELLLERYDELSPEVRWTLVALQRGVRRLTDAVPTICALVDGRGHGDC